STPASPPRLTAPGQPRFDYALPYEALGHNFSGFLSSLSGSGNPYRFSHYGAMDRFVERLLEGSPDVLALLGEDPFGSAARAPVAVPVELALLTPVSLAEHRATGLWWERRIVGTHLEETRRRDTLWSRWLPAPEAFHWDLVLWKRR